MTNDVLSNMLFVDLTKLLSEKPNNEERDRFSAGMGAMDRIFVMRFKRRKRFNGRWYLCLLPLLERG